MSLQDVINRHEKIALQCSGGRDSLATLYLLMPYWDRLTVYWLNSGDAYPETVQLMAAIRDEVPNFVEITGQQPAVIKQHGIPSDIVPASRTPMGLLAAEQQEVMIQDRYSCCALSIMLPMHQRMKLDGITLVIRGQKNDDRLKSPVRSGDVLDGIEYLFPIEAWHRHEVMDYLKILGAPIPRFYEMIENTPDCKTCSAWWEDGTAAYLKQYHPEAWQEQQRRLNAISEAVGVHIVHFNEEVNT